MTTHHKLARYQLTCNLKIHQFKVLTLTIWKYVIQGNLL